MALHGLGEQGACGAAANHHHPRLLPRPRHRRSRTLSTSRAPHPADKLPHPPSSRGVMNEARDREGRSGGFIRIGCRPTAEALTDAMGRWSATNAQINSQNCQPPNQLCPSSLYLDLINFACLTATQNQDQLENKARRCRAAVCACQHCEANRVEGYTR